jgi:molecular chaperone GrpE
MSEQQKNQLLAEFQSYLAQVDIAEMVNNEPPDLNTLLKEMAALSAEVKTQSRHYKTTVDTLSESLTTLQADNKALIAELAKYETLLQQQRIDGLRTLLLDMIDIYDRLTAGSTVLQKYHPVASLFGQSKKQDVEFIASFKEGQSMTLNRFEQLLQRYQVHPTECVGKLLNPHTMTAVEVTHDAKLENGIVIEELRKGFLYEDQVLRLAEVKVNKLPTNP